MFVCLFAFASNRLQTSTGSGESFFFGGLDGGSGITGRGNNLVGVVPFHQFGDVELWLLQHLDLSDVAVLDGEDGGAVLGDLVSDGRRNELLDQALEVSLGAQLGHGGDHLGADRPALCGLCVAGGLDLCVLRFREGDAKETNGVPVRCAAVGVGLDDGLLLSDEGAELVAGHVHAVEIQQAVVSLDILDAELDLAVGQGLVLLQIGETDLDDASLEVVGGDLGSLGLGDQGLSAVLDAKDRGGDQFVPFFLQERVDGLFAGSLLGLCQSLVLADSHLDLLIFNSDVVYYRS
mmetsp:Transcript_1154/g.2651  ORF Transcript_1154/g.2651 Transcript_1154/m.2651 type:complete len:292 (-) Transcript_1154:78-953(-)